MRSASELAQRNLFDVFNERDPLLRARAGDDIYAVDVEFHDPEGLVRGPVAVVTKAGAVLDQAVGSQFTLRRVRATDATLSILDWAFGPDGGAPLVTGTDVVLVENGRIQALYTALD